MNKKCKIIYMEEVMRINYNRYSLFDSNYLNIITEEDKIFKYKANDTVEILASEDEFNYIEYEFDNNVVKNTIKNFFYSNVPKLYLIKDVKENLSIFTRNFFGSYTLEGYKVIVSRSERTLFEKTLIECKKEIFSQEK